MDPSPLHPETWATPSLHIPFKVGKYWSNLEPISFPAETKQDKDQKFVVSRKTL